MGVDSFERQDLYRKADYGELPDGQALGAY